MVAEERAVGGERGGGRADAIRSLYDRHVVELYRYVHQRCRDRTLAEDITQDVFLSLARSDEDPVDLGIGWLKRVARNRLIDVLRRDDRHRTRLRLIGTAPDADDHGVSVADRMEMEAAMDALAPHHRIVLTLHYVDGLTVREIADELGRPPKGAEALLTRARAALRAELEAADA